MFPSRPGLRQQTCWLYHACQQRLPRSMGRVQADLGSDRCTGRPVSTCTAAHPAPSICNTQNTQVICKWSLAAVRCRRPVCCNWQYAVAEPETYQPSGAVRDTPNPCVTPAVPCLHVRCSPVCRDGSTRSHAPHPLLTPAGCLPSDAYSVPVSLATRTGVDRCGDWGSQAPTPQTTPSAHAHRDTARWPYHLVVVYGCSRRVRSGACWACCTARGTGGQGPSVQILACREVPCLRASFLPWSHCAHLVVSSHSMLRRFPP